MHIEKKCCFMSLKYMHANHCLLLSCLFGFGFIFIYCVLAFVLFFVLGGFCLFGLLFFIVCYSVTFFLVGKESYVFFLTLCFKRV